MTSGRIFWAVFFITIGLLGLMNNFTTIQFGGWSVWNFWPAVLILIGLAVILKDQKAKWAVMGATGALAGFLLFVLFASSFETALSFVDKPRHIKSQFLSQDYDGSGLARFSFSGGAGDLTIEDTTSSFAFAETESNIGNYSLQMRGTDSLRKLSLEMNNGYHVWGLGNIKNRVFVKLNPKPNWIINVEFGAASADINLSPFKTSKVTIDAGAASLRLMLGDRADSNFTRIEAGAASISIRVPKTADCLVYVDAPMSSKTLEGFKSIDDGVYQSEGFGSSKKKIRLEIDAGVSSLQIVRY
jgi:hypothetical protein